MELEARLKAQMPDFLSSASLSTLLVQSSAALQPVGSLLQAWGEVSQPRIPPCSSALSSSLGQQVQPWVAKMAEEEGKEVWEEEEEEVGAEPIFQVHPFQARTLLSPASFFWISFGYPSCPK